MVIASHPATILGFLALSASILAASSLLIAIIGVVTWQAWQASRAAQSAHMELAKNQGRNLGGVHMADSAVGDNAVVTGTTQTDQGARPDDPDRDS
jgi:hypothetical protein